MAHEVHEHIEHAGHGGGPGAQLGKWIGITIAILGVLMALCSALVGAARTELIATMVEENGAMLQHETVASKYRMLQAQLQQLHALLPDEQAFAATEKQLQELESKVKNADTKQSIEVTRLETKKILNTVTPTPEDMLRFTQLIRRHDKEAEAAKEWAGSYHDAVEVHSLSASRFEIAQLLAEIGIVIGSVGLLLQKRGPWYAAIVLGVVCLAIVAVTYLVNMSTLHGAEEKIHETRHHYQAMNAEKTDAGADERLLEDVEKYAKGTHGK